MTLITSDCDATRNHEHQMALITSGCARCRELILGASAAGGVGHADSWVQVIRPATRREPRHSVALVSSIAE